MSNITKKFTISFEFSDVFDYDQIWPNGNAPENPNTKDVLDVIRKEGSFTNFINNWNLTDAIDLSISDERQYLAIYVADL